MPLEHREAVETRHHHVEQHHVYAAGRHPLQRFHTVARVDHAVAEPLQPATQHVAIGLVVVHHEHGLEPARPRRFGHARAAKR